MPRYALKVEYDGKPYHGWQRQRDVPSVQQTIEIAISKIAPEKPEIQGAGRTDAGVHATGHPRDWPWMAHHVANHGMILQFTTVTGTHI